jgi:hypothetical protein
MNLRYESLGWSYHYEVASIKKTEEDKKGDTHGKGQRPKSQPRGDMGLRFRENGANMPERHKKGPEKGELFGGHSLVFGTFRDG